MSEQPVREVVTRVKIGRKHSHDAKPGFGRDVRYLTDVQLQAFLATEGREAREWGGRSIVRVDGEHVATLAATRRQSYRSRGRR